MADRTVNLETVIGMVNTYFRNVLNLNPDLLIDGIVSLPSVDSVEVVCCRDCKHYQLADNRAFGFPVKRCECTGFEDVDDDDFCKRGERKDGGNG